MNRNAPHVGDCHVSDRRNESLCDPSEQTPTFSVEATTIGESQGRAAPIRIIRLPEVCSLTGLGKSIIYRLQSERRFPQRVKITEYAVGWIEAEVADWIAQRMATRVNHTNLPNVPCRNRSSS